ncbi:DUF1153 domain-containing protein [Brevundimonas sp. 3P9-tot-E]|uniref:DUF1153 domain-containing protein n=1 Tax=unclassified Brevundimonas TaxID=2622653 RepID=UPI0028ADFACD|nr:DUF1153 domain-containing protein [Brevundimonas sp.]
MKRKGEPASPHVALFDRLDRVAYDFLSNQLGIQPQGTWSERWTPQRKLAVVIVARQLGDRTEELCRFLQVEEEEIRQWEERFQDQGLEALRANSRVKTV